MPEITTLADAVEGLVGDGDLVVITDVPSADVLPALRALQSAMAGTT